MQTINPSTIVMTFAGAVCVLLVMAARAYLKARNWREE
jgi:hypothetical protein